MNTKNKLNLLDTVKAANDACVKVSLQESKNLKHWKVDYSVAYEDGTCNEDSFIIAASDIKSAISYANDILATVAKQFRCEKWTVWNIGIMEDDVF